MEIVRKYGLWIIAGVVIALAATFYLLVVRKAGSQLASKVDALQGRRDKLKSHAGRRDDIPNAKWVDQAKKDAERINTQLDRCALFLAFQSRNCHTRRFYKGERLGVNKVIPGEVEWITGEWEWTEAYRKHNEQLQAKIDEAGFTSWQVETLQTWGAELPTDEQITEAQELFWFQKDLADVLTDLVEKELTELLKPPPDQPDAFPQKPSDLVITRTLPDRPRLDEPLRLVPDKKLQAVVEAILLNDEQQDLAIVFDTHLKDPDEEKDFSWDRVLRLTMDDAQRQFLDSLVADPEDLFNRRRFYNFIMELRSVRYRTDVADLLEQHGFEEVAESVRKMSSEERPRLLETIREWSGTRLAQTIAAVVIISDEKDYRIIRDNHDPQIAELTSLSITPPAAAGGETRGIDSRGEDMAEGPMRPRRRPGGPSPEERPGEMRRTVARSPSPFRVWRFSMRVKIEFEHIPVMLRRLLGNSWRYRISLPSIEPAVRIGTSSEISRSRGRLRGRTAPEAPERQPIRREPMPIAEEPEEVRNYVWVDIEGEGYQFTPLREKFAEKIEERTKVAAPTAPEPETAEPKPESPPAPEET